MNRLSKTLGQRSLSQSTSESEVPENSFETSLSDIDRLKRSLSQHTSESAAPEDNFETSLSDIDRLKRTIAALKEENSLLRHNIEDKKEQQLKRKVHTNILTAEQSKDNDIETLKKRLLLTEYLCGLHISSFNREICGYNETEKTSMCHMSGDCNELKFETEFKVVEEDGKINRIGDLKIAVQEDVTDDMDQFICYEDQNSLQDFLHSYLSYSESYANLKELVTLLESRFRDSIEVVKKNSRVMVRILKRGSDRKQLHISWDFLKNQDHGYNCILESPNIDESEMSTMTEKFQLAVKDAGLKAAVLGLIDIFLKTA
ncbi:uncharacterized protein LOC143241933 [Tachypleus tridentatus]|uniref:uncharacterized protein LOC143241933 n=1 Tax=Tachypleus tridentatus TaxID=6853 RepID=UPI003FCF5B8C